MFGESDSESPRSPSPWDSLSSRGIPKLVPEVEQGNVEYKLQLLSPTPARFARLVTQLNWRLLEGGGQAYYELGVADSGGLVGLPRRQLEESLETLEMMAGEIGASVIVVKEIEVPSKLSSLAESQLEKWEGRKSTRRKDKMQVTEQDITCPMSPAIPATSASLPFDFELASFTKDTMEDVGFEVPDGHIVPTGRDLLKKQATSLTASAADSEVESSHVTNAEDISSYSSFSRPTSLPSVPTTSISLPFDPALALFTKDLREDANIEPPDGHIDRATDFLTSLEIVSVYKPRPTKKRVSHFMFLPNPINFDFKHVKKKYKNGYYPSRSPHTVYSGDLTGKSSFAFANISRPHESRAQFQSGTRDLLTGSLTGASHLLNKPKSVTLEYSHVIAGPSMGNVSEVTAVAFEESRHVVEVLVVKKLLSDDMFLDFEGFSLE